MKSFQSESVNTETFKSVTGLTTVMSELSGIVGSNNVVLERVISGDDGGSDTFHSSSDHLSNSSKELELFVSGGSGSGVLLSESGTHVDAEVEEVGVSVDLLVGLGNEEFLFKDALFHLFKVVLEVLLVLGEVSDGLLELGLEFKEVLLGNGFFLVVVSKGVFDVGEELLEHTSDSFNGTSVEEHVNFRSGHLGEHSNDWGILGSFSDLDTGLEEHLGVGGQLDKGGFLSNEIVKEVDGTIDNREGTSVVSNSLDVKGMAFLSSGGSSGKGGSGVGKVLDGLGKVDLSLISGGGAGSKVIRSSSEASLTFGNLVVSELLLFHAGSVVPGKHGVVLRLLISDLVFELVEESLNVGKWATSLDLSFDLSEEVTEVTTVESVELSGLDSEA